MFEVPFVEIADSRELIHYQSGLSTHPLLLRILKKRGNIGIEIIIEGSICDTSTRLQIFRKPFFCENFQFVIELLETNQS